MPKARPRTSTGALHLRSLTYQLPFERQRKNFPFNLPILQGLETLEFKAPVTFFVGENGTGKSTLLEGLAFASNLPAVGSERLDSDPSMDHARQLGSHLRLAWQKRTHRGFFLRAEDFFGYARRMAQVRAELQRDLEDVDEEYRGRQAAHDLASQPYLRELNDLQQRYGPGLDSVSHGESFLALFQNRFVPDGLYMLDEPEAPLSPVRQLALISALKQMIEQQAQFIIATHSPILMAFPEAVILSFDGGQVHQVAYQDLEHVTLTRAFLDDPQAFINRL